MINITRERDLSSSWIKWVLIVRTKAHMATVLTVLVFGGCTSTKPPVSPPRVESEASSKDYSDLLHAVDSGDISSVAKIFAQRRVDPNRYYRDNETLLMRSSSLGDDRIVSLLLSEGANVNLSDGFGVTALGYSSGKDNATIPKLLVKAGAQIEGVKGGLSPLMLAVQAKDHPKIMYLLAEGANVGARDQQGASELTWSRRLGDREAEHVLLAHGAR